MKITTFYATDSGESRFRDITIPFDLEREDAFGHRINFSESYASSNVHMALFPADMDQDWHNAPARQLVVVLRGGIEVETTDGECRQWQAGDVFLPADVSGRGHRTRTLGGQPARLLFAPLRDDFNIDLWSD